MSRTTTQLPDRMYMHVPGLARGTARLVAGYAVDLAKARAPKLSGAAASRIHGLWGEGFFGVAWDDDYLWYQEIGIQPFTMRNLAGKTIPMWIDDPTGKERERNPKAKTRVTASGKTQVLIFRKAAVMGARKTVRRIVRGIEQEVDVPRSYPGAPGRIARRETAAPGTAPGRVGGRIVRFNVGVRWRHPGLTPRNFLYYGVWEAARAYRLPESEIVPTNETWR